MIPAPTRVLGIDPSTRCVAFAVLEGPGSLAHWGRRFMKKADSPQALSVIQSLIEIFQPNVLAIEDCRARESRRRPRMERLLDDVVSTLPSAVKVQRIPVGSLVCY